MSLNFFIKQNDTSPSMRATLKGSDGSAINLNNATVGFKMGPITGGALTVEAAADIFDAGEGVIEYLWTTDDTSTSGSYRAEIEVTYSDGKVETFPNSGFIRVEITPDIG